MGADAFKDGVKKITITNTGEHFSFTDKSLEFNNGTLALDHKFTNVDQDGERTRKIVKLVSAKL